MVIFVCILVILLPLILFSKEKLFRSIRCFVKSMIIKHDFKWVCLTAWFCCIKYSTKSLKMWCPKYPRHWIRSYHNRGRLRTMEGKSFAGTCRLIVFISRVMQWEVYTSQLLFMQGIKTSSGGVCCHNARGHMQIGNQIPRLLGQGIRHTVHRRPSVLW